MIALEERLSSMPEGSPADRRGAALIGVLLGTAVGDTLGLPMEGISARRQQALFAGRLRHRLIGHYGMLSDDTEHTMMVAQALLAHPGDASAFQRNLARQLRWWLAGVPAGVGFATLRAILKLWIGVPPARSGVRSAGNGAAMRSAVLGVYFAHDAVIRRTYVDASTSITHCDPRAQIAALAIAETAAWMTTGSNDRNELFANLSSLDPHGEWESILSTMRTSLDRGLPTADFAREIGATNGVSGYAYQSVPVAIHAALSHSGNFAGALEEAIACGGDTDTVGAMTGALVGANLGVAAIPAAWVHGIRDYPVSVDLLTRISGRLARQRGAIQPLGPVPYAWLLLPLRNVVFLGVVLVHGLRRLLPPF